LRLFSFGGYGLALAALALVLFGAYDSYPKILDYLVSIEGCSFGIVLLLDGQRVIPVQLGSEEVTSVFITSNLKKKETFSILSQSSVGGFEL